MDVPAEVFAPFKDRNLRFPMKPALVQDLHCFDMPDGLGIQIRGGEQTFALRGPLVESVIPWILKTVDGKKTVEELIAQRPESFSASEAAQGLLVVFKRGLIQKAEESSHDSNQNQSSDASPEQDVDSKIFAKQKLFLGRNIGTTRRNANAEEAMAKIAGKNLLFIGSGLFGALTLEALIRSGCRNITLLDWGADEILSAAYSSKELDAVTESKCLEQSLDNAARELRHAVQTTDLIVTATRNAPQALFEAINEICIEYQCKWIRANDTSDGIEVGPYVEPFYSACFSCMITRQACSLDQAIEEELYQEHIAANSVEAALQGESIATASAAAGHLCGEAIRALTEIHKPALDGAVLTIGVNGGISSHRFRRVPRCVDCFKGGRLKASEQTLSLTI